MTRRQSRLGRLLTLCAVALAGACREAPPADRVRVSGQVEATEVQVAAQVAGRLLQRPVAEGDRVEQGAVVATLDIADAQLGLARAKADLAQAQAHLRLLQAGSRLEDIRQAEAQIDAARAEVTVAETDHAAAQVEFERFSALYSRNSGSQKQRDDASARMTVARDRVLAARERVRVAEATLARVRAGARAAELDAARARIAAADAQVATWDKAIADATITAPLTGVVTTTVADVGELVPPRAPILVITDLAHAWANVYVDEPIVPRLRVGDAATLFTDAGGPGVQGTISYISERAEFTPRNVQTADDRSKLVYRVKVTVDNSAGTFKTGMPVEAEIPFVR